MQLYTVISSIVLCSVVVWTAPLTDENEIGLAKRAKERIVFGNQQNPPRRVKKNDPSLNEDVVNNDVDLKGHVLALPARDVPAKDEKDDTVPSAEVESGESTEVKSDDSIIEVNTDTKSNVSDVPKSPPTDDIDPDVQDMLQGDSVVSSDEDAEDEQNEDLVNAPAVPDQNEDVVNAPALPNQNEDQLANWYHYLLQYGDLMDNSPYSPQNKNRYYAYRRRRSLLNYFKGHKDDSNKAVKRGKRIKRDLYDDDVYYYPNQTPDNFEPVYGGFEPEVDESDLLAYLLSLYDREEEEPAYGYEAPYERILEDPEEEEPMFYPVNKRQMLSTVPGLRKRYFYPVNNEPQTHWGAFVPEQKREYLDAYDRVLRLARALESREEPDYYPEMYEGYKKK